MNNRDRIIIKKIASLIVKKYSDTIGAILAHKIFALFKDYVHKDELMGEKEIAEIIDTFYKNYNGKYGHYVRDAANKFYAKLIKVKSEISRPCPDCGGSGTIPYEGSFVIPLDDEGHGIPNPCPNCTDGRVAVTQDDWNASEELLSKSLKLIHDNGMTIQQLKEKLAEHEVTSETLLRRNKEAYEKLANPATYHEGFINELKKGNLADRMMELNEMQRLRRILELAQQELAEKEKDYDWASSSRISIYKLRGLREISHLSF